MGNPSILIYLRTKNEFIVEWSFTIRQQSGSIEEYIKKGKNTFRIFFSFIHFPEQSSLLKSRITRFVGK